MSYDNLLFVFPEAGVKTWKSAQTHLLRTSGLTPILYDCCINSCCCYAGPHKDCIICPYCSEPCYDNKKQPQQQFSYIPLIPWLKAYYAEEERARCLRYQHENYAPSMANSAGPVKDIFDGAHYCLLLGKFVTSYKNKLQHCYFDNCCDLALGLLTDGYAPFCWRNKTAWLLVMYNYNLPPDIQFHDDKVIYLGVVPGPCKPINFDLFLWPLMEEMLALSIGIDAWDADSKEKFKLCAYLLVVFGNIPAVSMCMRMKGHNGRCPCRFYNIKGVCAPGTTNGTLYVPLNCCSHPDAEEPTAYDPHNLLKRMHAEILEQGICIQSAATKTASKALATKTGVKGILLLSVLPTILFPDSFPYNFMHLLWENMVPNLQELCTGKFKGMDVGNFDYTIDSDNVNIIGNLGEKASAYLPYAFGAQPPNWGRDKASWTAKSCSFWTIFLVPVLLKGRLPAEYYNHFIDLVKLINMCLEYKMDRSKIQLLRDGFADWIMRYKE